MATWKCLHRRVPVHKSFEKYADSVIAYGAEHAHTITWRRMFADEQTQRETDCPGCINSNRRAVRHWAALGLAGLVLLVLGLGTCSARAEDPCAPYSPVDGMTCKPPTVLRDWHGKRVCVCRHPGVARAER